MKEHMVTDWLMVVITVVYVGATIAIYKANKKVADAAKDQLTTAKSAIELSKNLELLDKRTTLLDRIRKRADESPFFLDRIMDLEFALLYDDNRLKDYYIVYKTSFDQYQDSKRDRQVFEEQDFFGTPTYKALVGRIDRAFLVSIDMVEEEQLREEAARCSITQFDPNTEEERTYDLFEVTEKLFHTNNRLLNAKTKLLDAMSAFLKRTLQTNSI